MTDPRILPLEGVENFRDYGGYAARGGRIASGRLFRAAHQARATPADLAVMADLRLATVVDLRRPRERDNDPSLRHEGFAALVIQCDLGDQTEAPHVAFLRDTDLTPESAGASSSTITTRRPSSRATWSFSAATSPPWLRVKARC